MTDSDGARLPRPRQVTVGSGLALVSCVLLVLTMLDSMPRMRSVEMRDTVRDALDSPPGSGLGIEVDTVLGLLRVTVLVTGGLAAAGVVLAIFTLQRHRGARIGLSVIAVLMLFSATFVSGLLPLVVAIGALMLWSRDARDWFAGRPARPDQHAATRSSPSYGSGPSGATRASWPPPLEGGQPEQQPAPSPQQQPQQPWTQQHPVAGYGQPGPTYATDLRSRRPVTVTVACWLTWGFTSVTAMFLLLLVLVLVADPDQLLEALQANPQVAANGYTSRELLGGLWVIAALSLFWCLSAVLLAVLAYRRVNLGRIGLVVSAVPAGLLLVVSLVGLVHAVAAFATVALLFSGSANRWYAAHEPSHPSWPSPPADQQAPAPPQESGPRTKPPVW